MYKILFVCTGNICRSPTAEGVLRHYIREKGLSEKLLADSAGTHGYHVGEPPDERSIAAAQRRGIRIDDLRARKVSVEDFQIFDLILGLDHEHMRHLRRMVPANARAELDLFLAYAGNPLVTEVPDPYYGERRDFEYVLDLIESGVEPLLAKLQHKL